MSGAEKQKARSVSHSRPECHRKHHPSAADTVRRGDNCITFLLNIPRDIPEDLLIKAEQGFIDMKYVIFLMVNEKAYDLI